MNNDFTDLEAELCALQPRRPSGALEAAIEAALEDAGRSRAPAIPWWQQLGFHRPLAAFTWGFATPAAAVCAVLLLHVFGVTAARLSAPVDRPATVPLTAAPPAASGFEPAATSNVVYQTNDEGVVYDSAQKPARQVRYRSEDTLAWSNPHTGARVEVSYPREEVVLTPISLQ